jgi:hypothetical protein
MPYSLSLLIKPVESVLLTSLLALLFVIAGCGEPAVGRAVGVDSSEPPSQELASVPLPGVLTPPSTPEIQPPATSELKPAPTSKLDPTKTAVTILPTKVPAIPEPTKVPAIPEPTKVPATPEPTKVPATPEPTKVPATPEPTKVPATPEPTKVPANHFSEYGFVISLDEDTDMLDSNLSVTGLLSEDAEKDQGLMTFEYNGADIALSWLPQGDLNAVDLVDLGYSLLVDSQPGNEFIPFAQGDIEIDGELGSFGGLVVSDSGGIEAGGGLIGGWTCETQNIAFILMVTSPDSTVLQIRFDRMISGFECP